MIINISARNQLNTVVFLHETVSGRKGLKLPFLFGCGQLGLLSNQTEEYSDHQQLWNESMNTLVFLRRDNYQTKELFESTTWSSQIDGFFDHLFIWKE